jgi:hypothetical protein
MRALRLSSVGTVILALLAGMGSAVMAQETQEETPASSVDIEAVADMIMEAWAPEYDEAKVEAIYDPEVLMKLDTDVLAADREEIKSVISGALRMGNRYTQVGPVIPYERDDGDLYLASLVEVHGAGHPTGDPVVGFYRVRDGKVIRHIFMYAPDY